MRSGTRGDEANRGNLRSAVWIFIGATCLFVAISRGVFLYGDDILMYQVTRSIVEDGDVAVTSPHDRGGVARAIPGRDGEGYAKYGIGQSLAAIPFYAASDLVVEPVLTVPTVRDSFGNQRLGPRVYGTSLINAVIGGGVAAMVYLVTRALGYRERTGIILVILLITGTLLAHYSATFLSEPLSALCLLLVMYGFLMAGRSESPRVPWPWLAASGFGAGLLLATKLALGVTLIPFGIWFLWLVWTRWRDSIQYVLVAVIAWGLPVALWLAGIAFYNWGRFGGLTETGYGGEATDFSTPFLTGLTGLLTSPGRGIFWYNPPLILGIIGLIWLIRRCPAPGLVVLGAGLALILFYASYYQWYGGGAWGPRLLVPVIPLLLLPAAEIVERAEGRQWLAAVVLVIGVTGICVTALGILVPFDTYVMEYTGSPAALDDSIWNPTDSPIVVHLQRLDPMELRPDIAPVRYESIQLAVVSATAAAAGLAALTRATLLGFRGN